MKQYERKAAQATKKDRGSRSSRDPAWIGKPRLHAQAAKTGWLGRYKEEAAKLEAKRRPSRKDVERLQKLHVDIDRLTPRKAARKGPARKQGGISRNQPPYKRRAKKRATKTPVRKTPVRKTPVRKTPVRKTPVRKIPVRKVPVRKTPVRKKKLGKDWWRTLTGAELARAVLEMSKRLQEEQEAQRVVLLRELLHEPERMKERLLELRDEAILRGEIEFPNGPFNQPISFVSRNNQGQKIHVQGGFFLTDPGSVLEVMLDAARAANKLDMPPGATWIATISMLVYGQKTFGSPPSPWLGSSADATLFQVQSFESTGAQPTKLGMLDALQDKLDEGSEISNSVVWLEHLTIQQFTPIDTEEKKRWRKEQARKKREYRLKQARKKKAKAEARKSRLAPGSVAKLKKKGTGVKSKKKRALSGLRLSSRPKRLSKPKKSTVKPKKQSKRSSKNKAKKSKKVARKARSKSSTSSRSKVR